MFFIFNKRPEFLCRDKSIPDSKFQECQYHIDLCDSNIEMKKDPLRSVRNWSYDYDLYCSRDYYNDLISTAFFLGGISGFMSLSSIPDKYGRKNIFKFLLVLSCILHLNLMLASGPIHMMILFYFGGFFSFAFGMSFFIVTEYLPSTITGTVMGVVNALYPAGGVFIGFYFLYVNNWRLLFGIFFCIHLVIFYLTLRYFTESPRWLNVQGRKEECIREMENIAKINNNLPRWKEFIEKNYNLLEKNEEVCKENQKKALFFCSNYTSKITKKKFC